MSGITNICMYILNGNHMIIKITWRNYGKEFDNLHRKIIELGWVKPKKPWVFISKLKQGTLKGLDKHLILEKWWILVVVVFLAEYHTKRKKGEKVSSFDWMKWGEKYSFRLYVL